MYGNQVEAAGTTGSLDVRPPSLSERLEGERQKLQQRLEEIDGVLASLKASPETKDILDAVARLGHLHY